MECPGDLGGLALHLLCARIGRRYKVCLNGEGGDEVFGGYREYRDAIVRAGRVLPRLDTLSRLGVLPGPRARQLLETMAATAPYPACLDRTFADNAREQLVRGHLEPLDG